MLVEPWFGSGGWNAPWTKAVRQRALQWHRLLAADPRLRETARIANGSRRTWKGVQVFVYTKVRPG